MMRTTRILAPLAVVMILFGAAYGETVERPTDLAPEETENQAGPALSDLSALPVSFEPNVGQARPAARFIARMEGGAFAFARSGVAIAPAARGDVVRMRFVGAASSPRLVAGERLAGEVNYLHGRDPAAWHTGVPTYGGLEYTGLYEGIRLAYTGTQGRLKGTWTVAAGADPSRIRWRYDRAQVRVDAAGDLKIRVGLGGEAATVVERAPVAWQTSGGERVAVPARYRVGSHGTISFALGAYDAGRPLTIDPELVFSTYMGGSRFDEVKDVAVDVQGAVHVTGITASASNFPLRNPHQLDYGGGFDAFVTKLSPDGSSLVYSTFFGDGTEDYGSAIDVDADGNAYVGGYASSRFFPTTPGAYKEANGQVRAEDGFVAKLNPAGALLYSTLFDEEVDGLVVDAAGNAYLAAHGSHSVQECPGNYDALVAKLNSTGTALAYSTCFGSAEGGSSLDVDLVRDIAIDGAGNAYVAGSTESPAFPTTPGAFQPEYAGGSSDGFVTKFDASGSVVYSTLLGGGEPAPRAVTAEDYAVGIAVDGAGSAYVTGVTQSSDFPTKNALQDAHTGFREAFVTKLTPAGDGLVYSTYLGGARAYYPQAPRDEGEDVEVDGAGRAWVVGRTGSIDFPTRDPIQPFSGCCVGALDAFVTELSADGTQLLFSTYLGGEVSDWAYGVALDGAGGAYVAGVADSTEFPTTTGAFQQDDPATVSSRADGFVAKIDSNAGEPFSPDIVEITRAQYTDTEISGELEVRATSTDPTATLIVEVTATTHRIGVLDGKNGRYSGKFRWAVNPEHITVRSTEGGLATANVTTK
jgi:hypothetical protein